jgi:hypothetical protein
MISLRADAACVVVDANFTGFIWSTDLSKQVKKEMQQDFPKNIHSKHLR